MSFPSIPSIPTIPAGIGGIIRVPQINIPKIPQIPTIPPIAGLSGLSGLKSLGGLIPGLVGGGNLCGISIKQIDVFALTEVIKTALLGRLAGTTIAGVSGAAMLAKLEKFRQLSIQYTSFQADLQGLNPKDPIAVAAFLDRWKDKVPGGAGKYITSISDALNKGLAYDYCSLVPNINVDPTTGLSKVFAKMAPTPAAAPAAATPLIPTVINNTTKTSFGDSKVAFETNTEFLQKVQKEWIKSVKNPLQKKVKSSATKVVFALNDLRAVDAKVKQYGKSVEDLMHEGILSPSEAEKFTAYQTTVKEAAITYEAVPIFTHWFKYHVDYVGGVVSEEAYRDKREALTNDSRYTDYIQYLTKTESIVNSNRAIAIKFVSYQNNRV